MKPVKQLGVFCLEGEWYNNLKKPTSVEPVLNLLANAEHSRIPFIHRDVGTREELEFYLEKWLQRSFDTYPLLYLGFHGSEGIIHVGDQRRRESNLDFDWFEEKLAGRCHKRIIYFASCSTVNVHGKRLNRFLDRTDALAVCGYQKSVDWFESSVFDILLLHQIMGHRSCTRGTLRAANLRLRRSIGGLASRLKFRMLIRK